ncbi:MAG: hypothetical protein Q7S68_01315, partial [Deltaproteobacteria bacterium]|nr:hypothetical protein [Deltaproteobacteria bacterium]
ESFNLNRILRPILSFSDQAKIDQIFQEMKEKKSYISAIFDKKGNWLGIVTIGDIIEEIFGNVG